MNIEKEEEIQTKGIDNLISSMITENFPISRKVVISYEGGFQNTKLAGSKKPHNQTYIIKTFNIQN
jgi:hypothetical protein